MKSFFCCCVSARPGAATSGTGTRMEESSEGKREYSLLKRARRHWTLHIPHHLQLHYHKLHAGFDVGRLNSLASICEEKQVPTRTEALACCWNMLPRVGAVHILHLCRQGQKASTELTITHVSALAWSFKLVIRRAGNKVQHERESPEIPLEGSIHSHQSPCRHENLLQCLFDDDTPAETHHSLFFPHIPPCL